MARGIRSAPRFGHREADFEALGLRADLLRFADAELDCKPPHGFAMIEMMRLAQLAFAQNRQSISDIKDWNDRLQAAFTNAAIIDVSILREHNLLDRLRARGAVDLENWLKEKTLLAQYHHQMIKEAAGAAAGWMLQIEQASVKRSRGRPKIHEPKQLPDEEALLDWSICYEAGALMAKHPNPDGKSPWQMQSLLVPDAVAAAISDGRLTKQLGDTPQRNIDAHTDRIRRRLAVWMPDPDKSK